MNTINFPANQKIYVILIFFLWGFATRLHITHYRKLTGHDQEWWIKQRIPVPVVCEDRNILMYIFAKINV